MPTFVECKRASDTRNRREVVAQMLDYAANGIAYWPPDRLRQAATETAQAAGTSIDEQISQLLGSGDADVDAFWATAEANLRSGHVRLVFVADEIPRELRRLVEFLNEKMADVEVLAVEVKQFVTSGHRVVVPRVLGLTEAARASKRRRAGLPMTVDRLVEQSTEVAGRFFRSALDECASRGYEVVGRETGICVRSNRSGSGRRYAIMWLGPPDRFEFSFGSLPLDESEAASLRTELLAKGHFAERGRYTLRTNVNEETLSAVRDTFEHFLRRVEELLVRH